MILPIFLRTNVKSCIITFLMCFRKYILRDQDLIALTRTIRSGGDEYAVGSAFGMSKRTIRRRRLEILENNQNCPQISKRGGGHNQLITPEMEEWMIKFVEENSSATLGEIRISLLKQYNIANNRISLSTIHQHLDGNFISNKKQRYVSPNANTPEVIVICL